MAIPSEYRTQEKTIGNSGVRHPIYRFKVSLDRLLSEKFGPNTNQRDVTLLHPDMYDNSPDRGRTNAAVHQTGNVSWYPTLFAGLNIDIHDDGTITAYGQHAAYLKKTYVDVANPALTIVNYAPYLSADGDGENLHEGA